MQGPYTSEDGILKIQSMNERVGKYARFFWLEIKGIPLNGFHWKVFV